MTQINRRGFLAGTLGTAAAVSLPAWPARAAAAASGAPVYETHPATEPSGTHVRSVDGVGVVFAYGTVLPSFDGWRTHSPERRYVDLDGTWRFKPDPDASGMANGWNRKTFDDSNWRAIAVPSAWDLLDTPDFGTLDGSHFGSGTAFLDGYAWYRRKVIFPAGSADRHVRVNLLAAGYSADVWLDGVYLGKHEGASTPFSMPVPARIVRPGAHVLAVRAYRRASYTSYTDPNAAPVTDDLEIPYKPVDYWPYAGLTHPAWVESVATVSIAKILVDAADGRVDAQVVVTNHGGSDADTTVSFDSGAGSQGTKQVRVPAQSVRVVGFDLPVPNAAEWSLRNPAVQTAHAAVAVRGTRVDSLETRYGVRRIAVNGTSLELNGSPLFLKGTSWHEETAAHGRAMTLAEYDRELGHITTLGANFIRNCVYQRHPYVYDWTDSNGVLVLDEVDTMWLNTPQERIQTQQYGLARAMALSLAWDQHNRPSVIMWGVQNESEIDAGGGAVYRAWIADMKAAIKSVDRQQRPVTWASSTTNDPAFDLADVVGFNEYFGYFYGQNSDLGPAIDSVHAKYPDKPILITENGTWALAGNHGSDQTQGTEEWQANYIAQHWKQVSARSAYVAGYTLWVLKDYKERAGYNQSYNGVSVLGLLTFDTETPKLAYSTFRDLPMPG